MRKLWLILVGVAQVAAIVLLVVYFLHRRHHEAPPAEVIVPKPENPEIRETTTIHEVTGVAPIPDKIITDAAPGAAPPSASTPKAPSPPMPIGSGPTGPTPPANVPSAAPPAPSAPPPGVPPLAQPSAESRPSIAVLPLTFKDTATQANVVTALGEQFAGRLEEKIDLDRFRVFDRDHVQELLKEDSLANSDLADNSGAAASKLRLHNVSQLIVGVAYVSPSSDGNRVISEIQARRLDCQSGEILARGSIGAGAAQNFVADFSDLATQLGLRTTSVAAASTPSVASTPIPAAPSNPAGPTAPVAPTVPPSPVVPNTSAHVDGGLMNQTNLQQPFHLEIRTTDGKSDYVEGEYVGFQVRADADCYLTLVCQDSTGQITMLLPNSKAEKSEEQALQKGTWKSIPWDGSGFQYPILPPHGRTVVRAIATRKSPLKIQGVDHNAIQAAGFVNLNHDERGNSRSIGVEIAKTESVDSGQAPGASTPAPSAPQPSIPGPVKYMDPPAAPAPVPTPRVDSPPPGGNATAPQGNGAAPAREPPASGSHADDMFQGQLHDLPPEQWTTAELILTTHPPAKPQAADSPTAPTTAPTAPTSPPLPPTTTTPTPPLAASQADAATPAPSAMPAPPATPSAMPAPSPAPSATPTPATPTQTSAGSIPSIPRTYPPSAPIPTAPPTPSAPTLPPIPTTPVSVSPPTVDPNDALLDRWSKMSTGTFTASAVHAHHLPRVSTIVSSKGLGNAVTPPTELLVFRRPKAIGAKSITNPAADNLLGEMQSQPIARIGAKALGDDVAGQIDTIKQDPDVLAVVPNIGVQAFSVPSTHLIGIQWALRNDLNGDNDTGWNQVADDIMKIKTPLIGVVDQGLNITDSRLEALAWTNPGEIPGNGIDDDHNGLIDDIHGYNFVDNSPNLFDAKVLYNHGSMCASIIAGRPTGNDRDVVGIAPQAQIVAAVVMSAPAGQTTEAAHGDLKSILQGIDYVARCGARVINLSLGGTIDQKEYDELCKLPIWDELERRGIILVCAAGNDYADNDHSLIFPASIRRSNMVVVMAIDPAGKLARAQDESGKWKPFSNYGAKTVDIAAPGSLILGVPCSGDVRLDSGTSFSAPMVTAALALVMGEHPNWTHQQVIDAVLKTARPCPELAGKCITGGTLDIAAALKWNP